MISKVDMDDTVRHNYFGLIFFVIWQNWVFVDLVV